MAHLSALLTFISRHPDLAYAAIFLISLSESLVLVGLFVPGTVVMFGIGAIVSTGCLELTPVLLLAGAGAVAGDGISYWLGRHYRDSLEKVWPFSRYPGMLAKGVGFFRRHGGKSVLFGRFVGPVRPIIPVVAGMLGMGPLHFGIVNVLSAAGWALVYILPGVFFGASLAVAGAVSMRLAVLVFIVCAAAWMLFWLSRRLALLAARRGPLWLAALRDWAAADPSRGGIALHARRLFSYLFLRPQGEEWLLAFLILILLAAGWGFSSVLQAVLNQDPLVMADQAVYHFFQSLRSPWADRFLVAVTELGDSFVNISLAAAVLLVLLAKRCYRSAGFWALAALGGLAGVQLLKRLVHMPRPVALYQGISAYGFPSGHAAMSIILYGFLAIVIARGRSSAVRWTCFFATLLICLMVSVSRLYLGAHWLSDVLGGFLVGACWTALAGIAYLKHPDRHVPRHLLGLAALLVVVIAGGWNVSLHHQKDLAFYAPRHEVQIMPPGTWLADGWRTLPAWRIDMAGDREQPLTIQSAGSPDELARCLSAEGWRPPPTTTLKNLLGTLSPNPPVETLPVLRRLHDGRFDSLRLVRRVGDRRWLLRLWPTDVRLSDRGTPLFVGMIVVQQPYRLSGLVSLARDTGEYARPLAALRQMLQDRFTVTSVVRTGDQVRADPEQRRLDWRGEVLLVREKAGGR